MNIYKKKKIIILAITSIVCIGLFSAYIPIIRSQIAQNYTMAASTNKKLPIYCVDTKGKPKIAISFDAAWGADDTQTLIDILEKNDVKATFFLCGYWVDKYPEEVKKLYEAGHEIGNHSNTHPHSNQLSLEENKKNIMDCHNKIKDLLGIDSDVYRPPFGEYNNTVIDAANQCGYHVIQWDIDSLDWKEYGVEHEVNQVLNHKALGNGSIILFHNDAKYTPDALDTIIKVLKEKGFEIGPVGDLIYKEDYYMNTEGRQFKREGSTENTETTTENSNN